MTTTALDLYAGAGGWDIAAQRLGIDAVGVENMDAAIPPLLAEAVLRPLVS